MTATKTNERPGTRAQVKNVRMSATKARVVLDLVRNKSIDEAGAVLAYTERRAAEVIGKCLDSAVANAEHNDQIDPETLFVSACYADEGRTMYRWRPRARGRATRIRKRTCHITVIVSPMPASMLAAEQAKREAIPGSRAARRRGQDAASRAERVAKSQGADADTADDLDATSAEEVAETAEDEGIVDTTAEAVAEVEEIEADVEESETTTDEHEDVSAGVDTTTEADTTTEEDEEAVKKDAASSPEPSASEAVSEDAEEGSVPTGTDEERSDEGGAS